MSKKAKRLVIYFKDKLHPTAHGYSPGGAVFPAEVVRFLDLKSNAVHLVPARVKEEEDLIWLDFGHHYEIVIHKSKIAMIVEEKTP